MKIQCFSFTNFYFFWKEMNLEIFNNFENNIISVQAAKVISRVVSYTLIFIHLTKYFILPVFSLKKTKELTNVENC
jgi:hypothetical protein